MKENVLENFKFSGGSSSTVPADSAEAGGQAEMAGGDDKMKNESEETKMAKVSKEFFGVCDKAAIKKFRSSAKHGFNKLIAQGAENYFLLPEAIYDDAGILESEAGSKDSKDLMKNKISKFYTKAMGHMSEQILGMLVPGQVEMISRLQEVEVSVSTNMTKIDTTLEDILHKFEFYAAENKTLTTNLKASIKAIKDLEGKVDLYRSESEKLRQEMCLSDFEKHNYESRQPPYIGMHDPNFAHNMETNFDFDRKYPDALNQKSNQRKENKRNLGPNWPKKDMNSSSNAGVTAGRGLGADLRSGAVASAREGPGAAPGGNGMGSSRGNSGRGQPPDENGFRKQGGRRNKARNNTDPETEGRKSFKEKIMGQEFIIHNVESQDPKDFTREKEAELVQEFFTEIGVTYLDHFGVDVNIETDVRSQLRLKNHWEADPLNKAGQNGRGCAPIKVRMASEKICNNVLRAADKGGCLSGRRAVFIGKYKDQRTMDRAGMATTIDQTVAAIALNRPKYFIRPSILKEKRDRLKIAKEKRDSEQLEPDPETEKWKERKEERKNNTVYWGRTRNFKNGIVDEKNTVMLEDKKQRKEAADAARQQKEKEKAEKIALKNTTNSGGSTPPGIKAAA